RGATEYPRWLKAVKQTVDVTLGTSSAVAALKSRYALERFEQLASTIGKDEFVAWASFVFGTDVPLDAYRKLRDDLANKAVVPPEIQLVPGGVDGKDGAYDDATQEIGVSEELAIAAELDPPSAG